MKYLLKVGNSNSLYGLVGEEYEAGTLIRFTVPFMTDSRTYITSDEVAIKTECTGGRYECSFVMPACDVTVNIRSESRMGNFFANSQGFMGFSSSSKASHEGEEGSMEKKGLFCSNCGAKLEKENQKFCQECGAKQSYE